MSSLAYPFEVTSINYNGMATSVEQLTSYAAQARSLANADLSHLSIDRTRSPYNALGIRQLTSGTPLCPLNDAPAATMDGATPADLPKQVLPSAFALTSLALWDWIC
ncbi:uncharacterized protein N7484_003640 [Penicillium longicatenatum]|uniref:uncharacterized protein n=1 Tax=Penicillium longicatenatum TaxID=1561947 RepID=UPI002548A2D9|nr:uncharacterized protein N7484_003640 [Penicillium longicatenatum]KAJ5649917.1 hypothetical protein N7484_003640 [Penicillium longicatenatum]